MGTSWLRSNRVKAFFHVNRASSFSLGVRNSLELCGLGKMAPNVALMGFKTHWTAGMRGGAAADYVEAIRYIFVAFSRNQPHNQSAYLFWLS